MIDYAIQRSCPTSPATADGIAGDAHVHRIAFADALRMVAIFSVVVCHIIAVLPHTSESFAAQVETVGGWGVGCFFVLTGFLLGRPYLHALLDPACTPFPSTRMFFMRRFYRIFPLYAFAVVVTAAGGLVHGHHGVSLANVVAHLAFLQGFVPAFDGSPFGPLWTMAVDAQFYLLLPLIATVMYAAVRRQPRIARLRAIGTTLLVAAIGSIAWRWFIATHVPVVFSDFNTSLVFARNVIGMGASFSLGIGLALLEVLDFRPSARHCMTAVATGVLLIFAFAFTSIRADRFTNLVIGDLIAGLSAVLLLGGLISGRFPTLSRIARSPVTAGLAALSYAVYLFHKPIIVAVHDFLIDHGHDKSAADVALMILLSLVLLGVASVLGHLFIEVPFLNLRDKSRESSSSRGGESGATQPGVEMGRQA